MVSTQEQLVKSFNSDMDCASAVESIALQCMQLERRQRQHQLIKKYLVFDVVTFHRTNFWPRRRFLLVVYVSYNTQRSKSIQLPTLSLTGIDTGSAHS
jgi:dephospho-CoA kinase